MRSFFFSCKPACPLSLSKPVEAVAAVPSRPRHHTTATRPRRATPRPPRPDRGQRRRGGDGRQRGEAGPSASRGPTGSFGFVRAQLSPSPRADRGRVGARAEVAQNRWLSPLIRAMQLVCNFVTRVTGVTPSKAGRSGNQNFFSFAAELCNSYAIL